MSDYNGWDIQDLKNLYCDSYKDVHGIKARWVYEQDLTVEELKAMMNRLDEEYTFVQEEEARQEAAAEAKARKQIQDLIDHGAKDVATAICWMHEAHDTGGDNSFLDFELGTRYGFVASVLKNGL